MEKSSISSAVHRAAGLLWSATMSLPVVSVFRRLLAGRFSVRCLLAFYCERFMWYFSSIVE
jgi:hypothetical protein